MSCSLEMTGEVVRELGNKFHDYYPHNVGVPLGLVGVVAADKPRRDGSKYGMVKRSRSKDLDRDVGPNIG
jgi:hypothetical protein